MQIKGMSLDQWTNVVDAVSAELYDGNIIVNRDSDDRSNSRTNHCRTSLRVKNSRGHGARMSWSGRRTVSACWHAHRDVFREAFRLYPDAVISTVLARYTAENFEETYRKTAYVNVGSMMSPAYAPELCEHAGEWE